jgi:flagellar secretion chaperone FliS
MRAPSNPWKSYQQVATQTAPPGQLVLMLYEGAAKFLQRALGGFDIDDPAESNEMINNNIIRAQEIIFELNVTLNVKDGGELAMTLRRLYDYMDRRLVQANFKKEKSIVEEVLGRVIVLRDAWAQMLANQGNQLPAAIEDDSKPAALAAA